MSSYASVTVEGIEIFSWRNAVDPTFFFVFTSSDVVKEPIPDEERWDDDTTHYTRLRAKAYVLSDRLDALGIGRPETQRVFDTLLEEEIELLQGIDHDGSLRLNDQLVFLRQLTFDKWVDGVRQGLAAGQKVFDSPFNRTDPRSLAASSTYGRMQIHAFY